MNRHELRTCVFLLLYQKDFYPDEQYEEQQDIFLNEIKNEEPFSDEDQAFAEAQMEKIIPLLPEIDEKIAERKLNFMGMQIDRLTDEQDLYLHSFDL